MSGEGFARRWARLKGRGEVAPVAEEVPPDLESLALEDIAGWLKRNVPQAWKTAALRRMWVADAGIREFVGLADYAWDFNVPGGSAVFAPLGALDDVAGMLARAVGADAVAPVAVVKEEAVAEVLPPVGEEAPAEAVREVVRGRRRGGGATPV